MWLQGFNLWVRKIPWSRKWQPTPVSSSILENSMDRGAWRAKVPGSQRVRHDRAHPHTHSILGREGGQKGRVDAEVWAVCWWHLVGLNGLQDLGPGHCQPLLCDFAPLGLGSTDLPFLPKEEPAAIWPWLQLAWNLGGTRRKAAKRACRGPSEAAALLPTSQAGGCPDLLPGLSLPSHEWLAFPFLGRQVAAICAWFPSTSLPFCWPLMRAWPCSWQARKSEVDVKKQGVSLRVDVAAHPELASSFERRRETTEWHAERT